MLKCLDCGDPLDENAADERGVVRCDCGLKYALTFLQRAIPQRWEEARRDRAFTRHGSVLTLRNSDIAPLPSGANR